MEGVKKKREFSAYAQNRSVHLKLRMVLVTFLAMNCLSFYVSGRYARIIQICIINLLIFFLLVLGLVKSHRKCKTQDKYQRLNNQYLYILTKITSVLQKESSKEMQHKTNILQKVCTTSVNGDYNMSKEKTSLACEATVQVTSVSPEAETKQLKLLQLCFHGIVSQTD